MLGCVDFHPCFFVVSVGRNNYEQHPNLVCLLLSSFFFLEMSHILTCQQFLSQSMLCVRKAAAGLIIFHC